MNAAEDLIEEPPFLDDVQVMEAQDPLITEAEKRFGKDFVEVIEE